MQKQFMGFIWLVFSSQVFADQFHYSNVLVGDRAAGLGGAYTAVSDDASGVFYNPGAIAFAQENSLSGSVNAFYRRWTVYKETVAGDDFIERSEGSFSPFFGGLQKFSSTLVSAFSIYALDTELKSQNDFISRPDAGINRLHRAVNLNAATMSYGAAIGYRLMSNLGIGIGMNFISVKELSQEYHDADLYDIGTAPGQTAKEKIRIENAQNSRSLLSGLGVEPSLGILFAPTSQLSFGLTFKKGFFITQSYELDQEVRRTMLYTASNPNNYVRSEPYIASSMLEKPLGSMPMNVRLGAAWFANTRTLVSSDISYYEAVSSSDKLFSSDKRGLFQRESVTNYSLGIEFYLTPSFPLRTAFFTNNDTRPKLSSDAINQPEHIDYNGMSLSLSYAEPNSQMSLGTIIQQGTGKAQKVGNSPVIQDVKGISVTLALAATHNF